MAVLSQKQIEQLWIDNGGNPAAAPLMAAIALAENGGVGRTDAINDTPATKDYSVGLWQVNYFGSLLPTRSASYGTPEALRADPNAQARAAIAISGNGRNFAPWTTYTSNKYKKYLGGSSGGGGILPDFVGAVTNPANAVAGLVSGALGGAGNAASAAVGAAGSAASSGLDWLTGGVTGAIGTTSDAIMTIGRFFGALANPDLWRRLGLLVVGVAVVILGLVLINRDAISGAAGGVIKDAAKAAVPALV